MKLLVVTTEYGSESSGGVESVVTFVLDAVHRLTDWQVEVASLRMSRRAEQSRRFLSLRSWFSRQRVTTRTFRDVTVHDIGSSIAEFEPARFWPRRWLDQLADGADAVLVVCGTPAVCNALSRTKTPVVLQVATLVTLERRDTNGRLRGATALYRKLMTRLTARIDERGLRVPRMVLVENLLMLDECRRRGLRRVELSPPGVDTDVFRPGRRDDQRRPYILLVARLGDARKNVAGLLRAYSQARAAAGVMHELVMAGLSAPAEDDLRLIDELGLGTVVDVRSPVSRTELVSLYQGADLFASASFEEGLGLTYLEAMSCGLPVVTTENAGAAFILAGSRAGTAIPFGRT